MYLARPIWAALIFIWLFFFFFTIMFLLVKEEANKEIIIFRWNDGYRDDSNLDQLPASSYGAVY
jgi:hypothetical protein